jgi:Ca2+-binding RTX toxin-like protein
VHDSAGWGFDTLKVSCSYNLGDNNEIEKTIMTGKGDFKLTGSNLDNYLQGNKGDNILRGLEGSDTFWGGAGNDVMTGGADADLFHFKANSEREVITDFTDGVDSLLLYAGKQIKTIEDLLANHVHQDGKDLVISGDGTEMILKNFDKADLTVDDFLI